MVEYNQNLPKTHKVLYIKNGLVKVDRATAESCQHAMIQRTNGVSKALKACKIDETLFNFNN